MGRGGGVERCRELFSVRARRREAVTRSRDDPEEREDPDSEEVSQRSIIVPGDFDFGGDRWKKDDLWLELGAGGVAMICGREGEPLTGVCEGFARLGRVTGIGGGWLE